MRRGFCPKINKKTKCDTCNLPLPNGSPGAANAAVSRAWVELRKKKQKKQPEAVDKPSPNPPYQKTNYLKMQNETVELSLGERDKA